MRHYKAKRDMILRVLGKATFINGSQFVITWISPKGDVDVFASEMLQESATRPENPLLNREQLGKEAKRVKGELTRRWKELADLEAKGEAPTMEDDEEDPDRTLVEDERPTTPPPEHALTLAQPDLDEYYTSRFAAMQQNTCKLVVKQWIKIIEPKKQINYPYNGGEETKPQWWPQGVKHKEPDHLSKNERLSLLSAILQSPLVTISRLELSTAEAGAFISLGRAAILREIYIVAKEQEKKLKENDPTAISVTLPAAPISPSAMSPERTKRGHGKLDCSVPTTGFLEHVQKRQKTVKPPRQPLTIQPVNYPPPPEPTLPTFVPDYYHYPMLQPPPAPTFLQSPFDSAGSYRPDYLQQQQQQFMPVYDYVDWEFQS